MPIDFTVPEDGFLPHEFGLEMFWRVLQEAGPNAFEALHLARADAESDRIRAKVRPLIYGYSAAAAGAGAATSSAPAPSNSNLSGNIPPQKIS